MFSLHWQALQRWLRDLTPRERLALGLLLSAVIVSDLAAFWIDGIYRLLYWGVVLLALVALLRRQWQGLLGPVFAYDLVNTARKSPYFMQRCLYGLLLLLILSLLYLSKFGNQIDSASDLLFSDRFDANQVSGFAEAFFYTFMSVQFLAVFLLTPIAAGGAIADDKDRRTLEFLFTTDLSDREIIFGKLGSRFASLLLFLLAGLPFLSFLQLLGGLDPNLVLAGYGALLVTVLSLSALSIMNSAEAASTRKAILQTYTQGLTYLLITSICCVPCQYFGGALNPFHWIAAGNILLAVARLLAPSPTTGQMNEVFDVFRDYAVFHVILAIACLGRTARNMRFWYQDLSAQPILDSEPLTDAKGRRQPHIHKRLLGRRRPVGDDPVFWRECHVVEGFRFRNLTSGIGRTILVFLCFYLAFILFCIFLLTLAAGSNVLVRILGTLMAVSVIASAAVRAAGTISREREQQTLDGLLTTPLDNRTILRAKLLGSLWSIRRAWWTLFVVWMLCLLAGGLHVLALPGLILAWWVFALCMTSLGLLCSLVYKTTLRATMATILAMIALSAAPWVVFEAVSLGILAGAGRRPELEWLLTFDATPLMPPVSLVQLAWYNERFLTQKDLQPIATALAAVGLYGVLAAFFWWMANTRFASITQRMPYGRRSQVPNDGASSHPVCDR